MSMRPRKRIKHNAMNVARRALKLSRKNALGTSPLIHHDLFIQTSYDVGGTITLLSGVAQGHTEHTRRGEELRLLSVRLRIMVLNHATNPDLYMRFILFRDLDSNNPDVASASNGVLETNQPSAMATQDNKSRFFILMDKTITLDVIKARIAFKELYLNLRNVKASFDGVDANNTKKGHLYLLGMSNQATNTPTINIRSRVYLRSI